MNTESGAKAGSSDIEAEASQADVAYKYEDLGQLIAGASFTFIGSMAQSSSKRFSINFIVSDPSKDVALAVEPHFTKRCLFCSSSDRNSWFEKKKFRPLPSSFALGSAFSIQIVATEKSYLIAVNGYHIAEYEYKKLLAEVDSIEIRGDLDNLMMMRGVVLSYPDRVIALKAHKIPLVNELHHKVKLRTDYESIQNEIVPNLDVPYLGSLSQGLLEIGRCLRIDGRVLEEAREFSVNLQKGQNTWPQDVVAFHFKLQYRTESLEENAFTCTKGCFTDQWLLEECDELNRSLRLSQGLMFNMYIVFREQTYDIYLNRKKILECPQQVSPEIVDTIHIQGDIELKSVELNHRYIEDSMPLSHLPDEEGFYEVKL